ncbi:hypothetical protein F2P81_013361 [Scophthalmus maximus]|uniref:Uncharacterized protein n=1 Tax=Scophthalmus maximus TaxID=52904 RepID=A0A6A4SNP2_SCOMX|nr:hypothetical protein F2P81_013361 [Scophthalmus maximus]
MTTLESRTLLRRHPKTELHGLFPVTQMELQRIDVNTRTRPMNLRGKMSQQCFCSFSCPLSPVCIVRQQSGRRFPSVDRPDRSSNIA